MFLYKAHYWYATEEFGFEWYEILVAEDDEKATQKAKDRLADGDNFDRVERVTELDGYKVEISNLGELK